MSQTRGLASYRRTQVQSSTPLELVVMLYDGALTAITQAAGAIERRDIPARRTALERALAIVSELQSTLNLEQGGSIAATLDELYGYVQGRLLQAAIDNSTGPLDEARRVLDTLRDSWSTLATRGGTAEPAADVEGAA